MLHERVDAPQARRRCRRAPPATASTRLSVSSCRTSRAAARAERGAHRHLAPARRAAREQQVRDVGARDQQHRGDRAEQHDQRRAGSRSTSTSWNGRHERRRARRCAGSPRRSAPAIADSSACAAGSATPGRSRPIAFRNDAPRWSAHCAEKRDARTGIQICGRVFGVERKLEARRHHADDGDRSPSSVIGLPTIDGVARELSLPQRLGRSPRSARAPGVSSAAAKHAAGDRRRRRAAEQSSGVTTASGIDAASPRAGQRRPPLWRTRPCASMRARPARASRGSRGTTLSSGSPRTVVSIDDEPLRLARTAAASAARR